MGVVINLAVVVVAGVAGVVLGLAAGLIWAAVQISKLLTPDPRDGRGAEGLGYTRGPASEGDDLIWWDPTEASHKVSGMKKEDY